MKKIIIITNSIGTMLAMIFLFAFIRVLPNAAKTVQGTLSTYSDEQVAFIVTVLCGILIIFMILVIFLILSLIISLVAKLSEKSAQKKLLQEQAKEGKTVEENIEKENS